MNITVAASGIPTKEYPLNGTFEFQQAKALAKDGHNVSYLVFDFRPLLIKRKHGITRTLKDSIKVYIVSIPTGIYRRFMPLLQQLALYMFSLIEKEQGRQDIINAHFYSIGAICSKIPLHYNTRLVVTEHSSKLNKDISLISPLDIKVARSAYKNADVVIAVSNHLAQNLERNFGVLPHIVGDMVDTDTFCNVKQTAHSGFNILSVSRLVGGKGFEKLIPSIGIAIRENPSSNISLTIIGDGIKRSEIETLIVKHGIQKHVKLLGEQNHTGIVKQMEVTDLFVLLSESETFGVSYAEAICAGIPVIATRCGGPETFINNNNGILVSKENCVTETSDAITSILNGEIKFNTKVVKETSAAFYPQTIAQKISDIFSQLKKN